MEEVCCPKCGSFNTIENALEEDDSKQGYPRYSCGACRTGFGSHNGSIYSGIVKEITLDIKGLFTDKLLFNAKNVKEKSYLAIKAENDSVEYKEELNDSEWKRLTHHLFDSCFLDSWKSVYYSKKIIDGTSWNLEIRLHRKYALHFHGCNGFPPYWNELLSYLEPFFERAGLSLAEYRF